MRTATQHDSRTSELENRPPAPLPPPLPPPPPSAGEGDHGDAGEEEGGAGDGEEQREERRRVHHQRAALLTAVAAQGAVSVAAAIVMRLVVTPVTTVAPVIWTCLEDGLQFPQSVPISLKLFDVTFWVSGDQATPSCGSSVSNGQDRAAPNHWRPIRTRNSRNSRPLPRHSHGNCESPAADDLYHSSDAYHISTPQLSLENYPNRPRNHIIMVRA